MKKRFHKAEKKMADSRVKDIRNPIRRANCETNSSRKLKRGPDEPPDPQGACAPESEAQGSE